MEENTRNAPRVISQGDRRKLRTVLWELKNTGIFKDFTETTGGIEASNRIGFSLILHGNHTPTLYFYARKNGHGNSATVETGIENSSNGHYLLGEQFSKDELFKTLRGYINRHNVGFAIENELLKKITNYLLDETKPRHGIKYVRVANTEEDINGVDMYFGMKLGEFPLQVKKNVNDQKKHIEKFPKIPSYVFDPKLKIGETVKLFAKLAELYFKGQIEHR